jgi:hypothetical protein
VRGVTLELTRIAGGPCGSTPGDDKDNCGNGDCPTVFRTDRPGMVAVQGYTVEHETPDGEGLVMIPVSILMEAARALGIG